MVAKKKYDRTKQKETLKKVLEYIEQYRAVLVFSLILAAVTVACTLYLPILTGDAINLIWHQERLTLMASSQFYLKVLLLLSSVQWLSG